MAARRFAAGLAALCVACAPVALAASDVKPRISPKPGHPSTVFRVGFTAPQSAGRQGATERSYWVELSVRGRGCSQTASRDVPNAVAAGERVHVRFLPPSERWCLGKGRGKIWMSEGPYCDPSDPYHCPAGPSSTREIAHFNFRVVRLDSAPVRR
jgi:hypothetical protein